MMSLVVCKVGTGAGATTTGNVIVIPTTQAVVAADDLPLPTPSDSGTTGLHAAVPTLILPAFHASGSNPNEVYASMGMIAGTDEYLGAMTYIS